MRESVFMFHFFYFSDNMLRPHSPYSNARLGQATSKLYLISGVKPLTDLQQEKFLGLTKRGDRGSN